MRDTDLLHERQVGLAGDGLAVEKLGKGREHGIKPRGNGWIGVKRRPARKRTMDGLQCPARSGILAS